MNLDNAAEKIRTMEVRGAGRIARFAVSTIKELVNDSKTTAVNELQDEIVTALNKLNETRPTAVSLKNSLRYVYSNSLVKFEEREPSIDEFKNEVISACETFIAKSEAAVENIGENGADLIKDGYVIQTHCNSQNALAAIIHAHKEGKDVAVFATESRPWFQGHITARTLAEAGIPVTLIVDSAVKYHINQVNLVLVGADTITSDGDLINKIGTSQIALTAFDAGVPFYVCAETYKFSPVSEGDPESKVIIEERPPTEVVQDPGAFPGVTIANPVFDITPAKHITGIITENGIIKPDDATRIIEEEFGEIKNIDFLN